MKKSGYIWLGVVVLIALLSGVVISNTGILCDGAEKAGVMNASNSCSVDKENANKAVFTGTAKANSKGECPYLSSYDKSKTAAARAAHGCDENKAELMQASQDCGSCPYKQNKSRAAMAKKEAPDKDKEVALTSIE
ncbi:MAG: hypothetical protein GWN16_09560 [Calditrichae bacterium]|nr:hypothetical protein [Calditrichia bacterium]